MEKLFECINYIIFLGLTPEEAVKMADKPLTDVDLDAANTAASWLAEFAEHVHGAVHGNE